ncbi:MAG: hypothetical protein EXX96DRAFT_176531 [Benjaminiella poitrasii]|nr:MAG: hypothetical protein EXX96DRAFT_176531 [Benjaminiella poitrasii]
MPRLMPLVAGLTLAAAITYKFKTDLLNDQRNIKNRVEDVKTTLGKAVIEPGKATGYTTSSSYLSDSQKYISNRLVPSGKTNEYCILSKRVIYQCI